MLDLLYWICAAFFVVKNSAPTILFSLLLTLDVYIYTQKLILAAPTAKMGEKEGNMFNLKTPTKEQEYQIFNLKKSGTARYLVVYYGYRQTSLNGEIANTDNYLEAISEIGKHYKSAIEENPSLITDISNDANYYDIIDLAETDQSINTVTVYFSEIAKISMIMNILGYSKDEKKKVKK